MQDSKQLAVWQKAHALVLRIYEVFDQLPPQERFGLAASLRHSAFNIPRAIAEGAGQGHNEHFALDLRKARASGHELEYILLLCRDLGFLAPQLHDELASDLLEVGKMTSGLLTRVAAPEGAR